MPPPPDTSDHALEAHLPDLLAYIRAHAGATLRTRETSRDLLQSVCREVLERAPRFHPRDGEVFRHWVFEIAFRKIHDRLRFHAADKRAAAREERLSTAGGDALSRDRSPSHQAILREELARVEQALLQLPPDHRNVILWSKGSGMSHREIAHRLGRTEQASRMLLARALAKLAGILDR